MAKRPAEFFSDRFDQKFRFQDLDGISPSYEMIDENPLRVQITLNGEACETSAVESRIIPGYTQEQAGVS